MFIFVLILDELVAICLHFGTKECLQLICVTKSLLNPLVLQVSEYVLDTV